MHRATELYNSLYNICLAVSSTFELDTAMQKVVTESAKAIGCESSLIAVLENDRWIVKNIYNLPEEISGYVLTPDEATIAILAAKARKCVAVSDTLRDRRIFSGLAKKLGIRSALAIPLTLGKEIPGILLLNNPSKETAFTDIEISFADKIATTASVVLQNVYLLERSRQSEKLIARAKELSDALNSINTIIHSSLNYDEIMRRVVMETARAVDAGSAMIYLRREGGWQARYVFGLPEEVIGRRLSEEEVRYSVLSAVEKRSIVVNDVTRDTRVQREIIKQYGIHAILDVALTIGDELVGDFVLHHHLPGKVFDELIADFVNKVAGSLTLALKNARLYEERREITEALRESEDRFRRAFTYAASGMLLVGRDGLILQVNRSLCQLLGYPEAVLLGRKFQDLTHPDDLESSLALLHNLAEGRSDYGWLEKRYFHRDGHVIWALLSVAAIRDNEGKVLYYVSQMQDMTGRKEAEEALKRAADTGGRLQNCMVAISSSRSFEDALKLLLDAALELSGMEGGGVYLVEKELAVLKYHKGLPAAFVRDVACVPLDRPIFGAVLKQEDLIDLAEEPGDMRELFRRHRVRHAFSIPLRIRDETFGFLNVGSTRTESPARNDIQTLTILATATESLLHRLLIEDDLRQSEAALSAILNNTPAAVYMLDTDGRFIHVNRRFEELVGIPGGRAKGRSMYDLFPREVAASLLMNNQKVIESRTPLEFEEIIPLSDGIRIFASVKSPLIDASGQAYAVVGISTDISDRKKMEEEIRHMANHDVLTGLPNRRLFKEILTFEAAQAQRHGKKIAIFFLDLDRFKEINDTLGHATGDLLLKEVASRLKSLLRRSDSIGRIGGDEFNIIVADSPKAEDISDIARKLVDSFRKPFPVAGHELYVTTSIGISIYPDDSTELNTLLRYADIAMYHAKENGRNNYQFYNPSINLRSIERIKLRGHLRHAIHSGELLVYYQPQIDIRSGRMVCAEALVRWNHPKAGLLEPKEFLPLAEETGLIISIGQWVLNSVCTQVRTWLNSGLSPVCITVNLSAKQFQSPTLVNNISSTLDETGMSPGFLGIEITETTVMSNMERTVSHLGELAGMGIHISVDDFGTGYSSLNYLKKLPIEKLKIDQSFIRDIMTDPDDRAIINAVISMARSMDMRTVAEGVELEDQLSFLRASQCDEAQGFFFSRPLPSEKFTELMAAREGNRA